MRFRLERANAARRQSKEERASTLCLTREDKTRRFQRTREDMPDMARSELLPEERREQLQTPPNESEGSTLEEAEEWWVLSRREGVGPAERHKDPRQQRQVGDLMYGELLAADEMVQPWRQEAEREDVRGNQALQRHRDEAPGEPSRPLNSATLDGAGNGP